MTRRIVRKFFAITHTELKRLMNRRTHKKLGMINVEFEVIERVRPNSLTEISNSETISPRYQHGVYVKSVRKTKYPVTYYDAIMTYEIA